jgi:molybdate transport system substrate-binding protein
LCFLFLHWLETQAVFSGKPVELAVADMPLAVVHDRIGDEQGCAPAIPLPTEGPGILPEPGLKVMPISRRAALALVPCLALPAQAQDKPLLMFAASSLQPPLMAIAERWKVAGRGSVLFSFASSAALAKQIESGAPADLFASADPRWMADLVSKDLIRPQSVATFLGNALVLVSTLENPAALQIKQGFALAAALADGKLATGTPDVVPLGTYAKEALTSLGIWDAIAGRIAGTENARLALALVARGEARYGIVYASDAKSTPSVRLVDTFPANSHTPIRYPIGITAASTHDKAAAFLAFLQSDAALAIFREAGFSILLSAE